MTTASFNAPLAVTTFFAAPAQPPPAACPAYSPEMFRIKVTLHDGTVKFSAPMEGHEFVDRLAKECRRDPAVKTAEAVPV